MAVVSPPDANRTLPPAVVRRALVYARAYYAFSYGAGAFLWPFLSLYYSELGFSGKQIGVLRGIAPLVTVMSAPLWGGVADTTGRHKLLRLLAVSGTWLAALGIANTQAYASLIGLVLIFAFFQAPGASLVDTAVLALLGDRRDDYGTFRLWGAVGWGIAALTAGLVADRFGLIWCFAGFLVLMIGTGLTMLGIPNVHVESVRRSYAADLRGLLTNRAWIVFLLVVLVGTLYHAVEMHYLLVYLDALAIRKSLMGVALVFATLGELPVWALTPRLLRRWGPRGLLIAAFAGAAVQGLVYATRPPTWLALGIQVLHGLAFPAMWAGGVAYVARVTPEGVRATAQGVFGALVMGVSSAVGALLGGWLFDSLGGAAMFGIAGGVSLAAVGLMAFTRPATAGAVLPEEARADA